MNKLSHEGEVFYRRLMSVVDDFGRYYAEADLLRASCYPLRVESVRLSDIERSLSECEGAGLLIVYESATHLFLELSDFRQQLRAKRSKYPSPKDSKPVKCSQSIADSQVLEGVKESAQHMLACAHLGGIGVGDGIGIGIGKERANARSARNAKSRSEPNAVRANNRAVSAAEIDWCPESGWSGISQTDQAEWAKAYPACDVAVELDRMHVWLKANPAKARKSRWSRFIVNWLSRSQDRGGSCGCLPSGRTSATPQRGRPPFERTSATPRLDERIRPRDYPGTE